MTEPTDKLIPEPPKVSSGATLTPGTTLALHVVPHLRRPSTNKFLFQVARPTQF